MSFTVYYDYHDGVEVPIWIVVSLKEVDIETDKQTLTLTAQAPFYKQAREDFDPDQMNVTVTMNELIIGSSPNTFTINIKSIQDRLDEHSISIEEVDGLILLVADVEELLQFTL
ncbi:hypothetical protein ACE1TH_13625 [Shouchella sp. JSM 1781072]|uniref:hypothetical protein n=1 Tax=Bacillaceae TaxID=186817 RepID=UPI000C08CA7B|nr:hypothetical protein [Bacillus sp. Marseille-P3800]